MNEPATTAEQIRQLREHEGIGLQEAKRRVERQQILREIDAASHFYALKDIVRKIAERVL